jgi:hypothetical protein
MDAYIVLPRNFDMRAAVAAARAGSLRTISVSAMNREIVTTLVVAAPIILSGCSTGDLRHLARHNRCIPFNGGAP